MTFWLPATTAFLASLLEGVEALTIVLAVGATWGWRPALRGAFAGIALVGIVVVILGPAVVLAVPIGIVRVVVGVFLLLFGMSWLRKAIQRYGGRRALRDEAAAFERHIGALRSADEGGATLVSFKSVTLELLEVAIIVATVGGATAGGLIPAAVGALAALILVAATGFALRAPLARVPENALGFLVGIMLTSFGTYWAGEGLGVEWWHEDLAIVYLVALYAIVALACVGILRASGTTVAAAEKAT